MKEIISRLTQISELSLKRDLHQSHPDHLSPIIKRQCEELIKKKYGDTYYDESKLFSKKINNVIYKLDEHKNVIAVVLLDRRRIYAVSAENLNEFQKIVIEIIQNGA